MKACGGRRCRTIATGQGQRADPEPPGLRVGPTDPSASRVLLTVSKSDRLQRPEQLTADALAVPSGLGQALGHCEVKGVQITAGVSVRCGCD